MYYGQFNPQVDRLIHERFFPNTYDGISIEAGAFDGLLENNTKFFEENYRWKTINVEPLPFVFRELELNRPKSLNFKVALSNKKGTATLHNPILKIVGTRNTWSSLTPSKTFKSLVSSKETFTVKTITYNDLIEMAGIDRLDLFTLDVEGHELEVLESFDEWKLYPTVFVIETGHMDQETKQKLKEILEPKYEFQFQSFVNAFYKLR